MLNSVLYSQQLPFAQGLMDSWYATKKLMAQIDSVGKIYDCPLKTNRRVDDSSNVLPDQRVDELNWSEQELEQGKLIKIRGFPAAKK